MVEDYRLSVRQACKAVKLPQSTYHYKPKPKDDAPIIQALDELVTKHPSIGFDQGFSRLRLQGYKWNHKRVYRVYTQMNLNIRRRAKKKAASESKTGFIPTYSHQPGMEHRLHV